MASRSSTVSDCSTQDTNSLVAEAIGNAHAWSTLYDSFRGFSKQCAYGYLRNHHDAEDVVQAAWIRVFTSLHQYRGTGKFSSWLGSIILNECRDLRKRKGGFRDASFDDERTAERGPLNYLWHNNFEAEHQRRDMHRKLHHQMRLLPSIYRSVLMLHYIDRLSISQIAQKLMISESATKSRLGRARIELASRMR